MVNILFTSVGRRVELLRAFRNAYKHLGLPGKIVAVDMSPLAPALQAADVPHIVPRLDAPDYMPTLLQICEREAVDAIFPLIDPDIPTLAAHHEAIEATGARLAVVSSSSANIAGDKWLTYEFFQRIGLTTPCSWLPGQYDLGPDDYPLFIKPRRGSAAKGTFKVRNEQELTFFSEYVHEPIIQEYLPGPEITCDVIVSLEGEFLSVAQRRRIEVRWGEVAKGITVYEPDIGKACARIAAELPAVGPITVQGMMKDGIFYFTEINARLGGGVPLGIAAGVDGPRWLLARLANIDIEIPPLGSYQVGLCMTRFDDSFFLSEDQVEQMESNCL
ncbi:MAG: ATP-grasp domain-containing protein [Anaerolineae bacterium]|nr:ATP-grasp domain-containing protein [Anaerolineae bacterium]